ncbi:hypothetical protein BJF93_08665 [Xaviernesmea oryzae]|uniref:diguanylate cyclase n=1 Tax=Xaviernesmea oryzae TaxID=464029 RepID=A0A1Q9B109_9HYPH|nr:hypothetical protein BJF93_08665 [Xaviernesmea oryzae]
MNRKLRSIGDIARLDGLFRLGVIVTLLCTGIFAAVVLSRSYRDFVTANDDLRQIERYRLVLDVSSRLSSERNPSHLIIGAGSTAPPVLIQKLATRRARADQGLRDLVQALPEARDPTSETAKILDRLHTALSTARGRIDALAVLPTAQLTSDALQEAVDKELVVSDLYEELIDMQARRLSREDGDLTSTVFFGRMLAELRDYSGRLRAAVIVPLTLGEPLPLANIIAARRMEGRVLQLWSMIEQDLAAETDLRMADTINAVRVGFLQDGLALLNRVIFDSIEKKPYSINAIQMTEEFGRVLRPLDVAREAILGAMLERFEARRWAALMKIASFAAMTVLIAVILLAMSRLLARAIFAPLVTAHDAVMQLSRGERLAAAGDRLHRGELAELFTALDALDQRLAERERLLQQTMRMSETDALTGLHNRRALELIVRQRERDQRQTALILIDIDRFKAINDTHGHLTGDDILVGLAKHLERVRDASGAIATVARFGGEEFAILTVAGELEQAAVMAETLRRSIADLSFELPGKAPLRITASFGVAVGPSDFQAWQSIMAAADAALYKAKETGRNRVCIDAEGSVLSDERTSAARLRA